MIWIISIALAAGGYYALLQTQKEKTEPAKRERIYHMDSVPFESIDVFAEQFVEILGVED